MSVDYRTLYIECKKECKKLLGDSNEGIHDFNKIFKHDLQKAKTINDVFIHFVEHSQNRAKGRAIKLFEFEETEIEEKKNARELLEVIQKHEFKTSDKYDYITLFNKFKDIDWLSSTFHINKSNDILYLQLAKTCLSIKKFLSKYETKSAFQDNYKFTTQAENNWKLIEDAASEIYNMDVALVADFFKEQKYIEGRKFLIKPDIHVTRFLKEFFSVKSTSEGYQKLLDLYLKAPKYIRDRFPVYNLDKMIFKIGKKYHKPQKMKDFANKIRDM